MTPLDFLRRDRQNYPLLMTPAQIGEMLNRLAWTYRATGMALLGKKGGNSVPTPSGELISSDYIVHVPTRTGHDILTDRVEQGDGNGIIVAFEWGPGPENLSDAISSGARSIVLPTEPGAVVEPPDDGTGEGDGDEPPVTVPSDHEARIQTLEAEVKNLNDNILSRLTWLEHGQTGPDYKGTGKGTGTARVSIPFVGSRSVPIEIEVEVVSKPVFNQVK